VRPVIVRVPVSSSTCLPKDGRLEVVINGEKRTFPVEKRYILGGTHYEFVIRGGFPKSLVKVLFGPNAVIEKKQWEEKPLEPLMAEV